jgi:hypothetical protein
VQFWHAWPPVPHVPADAPPAQKPLESQQPPHVCAVHMGTPVSVEGVPSRFPSPVSVESRASVASFVSSPPASPGAIVPSAPPPPVYPFQLSTREQETTDATLAATAVALASRHTERGEPPSRQAAKK